MSRIRAVKLGSPNQTLTFKGGPGRQWIAYVDGEMLRNARGVGRGFATEATALRAARIAAFPRSKPPDPGDITDDEIEQLGTLGFIDSETNIVARKLRAPKRGDTYHSARMRCIEARKLVNNPGQRLTTNRR